jgi:hypothetical protein
MILSPVGQGSLFALGFAAKLNAQASTSPVQAPTNVNSGIKETK